MATRRTAKIIPIAGRRRAQKRAEKPTEPSLADIDRGWLELHAAAFPNGWLVRVVRVRVEVPFAESVRLVASLPNARGQYRPAAEWDVEIETTVEVETRVRVQLRVGPTFKRSRAGVRRAA